ncbi:hypothetical protein [Streptomyces minutiscleroticus]|uniref:hypothetical protein n=1 Tax=Streptomyces minutiscleroticus TaxID=68238 RepID=UPI00167E5DB2|nr:hypothetical protein [Streptomyces minutiscleroticus]
MRFDLAEQLRGMRADVLHAVCDKRPERFVRKPPESLKAPGSGLGRQVDAGRPADPGATPETATCLDRLGGFRVRQVLV